MAVGFALLFFLFYEFYCVEFAVFVTSGQVDFAEASDCEAAVDLVVEFWGCGHALPLSGGVHVLALFLRCFINIFSPFPFLSSRILRLNKAVKQQALLDNTLTNRQQIINLQIITNRAEPKHTPHSLPQTISAISPNSKPPLFDPSNLPIQHQDKITISKPFLTFDHNLLISVEQVDGDDAGSVSEDWQVVGCGA